MKQIFLTLSAALMLTGCNGLFNGKADTAASDSDSIVSAADSLSAEGFEEGEADGTEAQGLSIYDQQDFDDLSALPASAEETDRMFNHVLYVNVEEQPSEDDPVGRVVLTGATRGLTSSTSLTALPSSCLPPRECRRLTWTRARS